MDMPADTDRDLRWLSATPDEMREAIRCAGHALLAFADAPVDDPADVAALRFVAAFADQLAEATSACRERLEAKTHAGGDRG